MAEDISLMKWRGGGFPNVHMFGQLGGGVSVGA
jgi:hypothetical protein